MSDWLFLSILIAFQLVYVGVWWIAERAMLRLYQDWLHDLMERGCDVEFHTSTKGRIERYSVRYVSERKP